MCSGLGFRFRLNAFNELGCVLSPKEEQEFFEV